MNESLFIIIIIIIISVCWRPEGINRLLVPSVPAISTTIGILH